MTDALHSDFAGMDERPTREVPGQGEGDGDPGKQADRIVYTEARPSLTPAETCIRCWKSFISFLFSTVGLTLVLVGYTFIGGIIFCSLETPYEERLRSNMKDVRTSYVANLWTLTKQLNILHPVTWKETADQLLLNYTLEVLTATKKMGWDGKDSQETELQWSFPPGPCSTPSPSSQL